MSEYGSEESTNGEQDIEQSPQKSPAPGEKSPGQSSSSSSTHADDEGGSPCSSSGGGRDSGSRLESSSTAATATGSGEGGATATGVSERPTSCLTPQQFTRVAKDNKSTCARTDLVYVHPPAAEREMAASTTKVCSDDTYIIVLLIQLIRIAVSSWPPLKTKLLFLTNNHILEGITHPNPHLSLTRTPPIRTPPPFLPF